MARKSTKSQGPELDLSDVDHLRRQADRRGQLWDPCSSSDIRRWVMAMNYPNPLHWDQEFARESKFGGIVAPQSIAVALDYGHGAAPACVGHIPNSRLIFGGEEWWFYGCPVRPGDQLFQERRFHDYKVVETKFAGPTMFSRGDTTHIEPAWRPRGAHAVNRDPLPLRRSQETRHVRKPASAAAVAASTMLRANLSTFSPFISACIARLNLS